MAATNNEGKSAESGLIVSTTVLMPGTRLTYHFERPDRRELVEEALYQDGHLVVLRTETGDLRDEVPSVGTLAEIVDAARPAPDRLMAVLGGVRRIQPAVGPTDETPRYVEWSEIEAESTASRALEVRAGDVLGLLQRLRDRGIEMAGSIERKLGDADPSRVADIVASIAFDDIGIHQELLEETDVLSRLDRVEQQLDHLLRRLDHEDEG